jgi:hypothetical protein
LTISSRLIPISCAISYVVILQLGLILTYLGMGIDNYLISNPLVFMN